MSNGTLLRIIHNKEFNPVDFDNELRSMTMDDDTPWIVEHVWMRELHVEVTEEGFQDWYYANLYISYRGNIFPHANVIASYVERMSLDSFVTREISDAYV